MQTSRRTVLSAGLVTGSVALAGSLSLPDQRASAASPALPVDPFTLGVASGDPSYDGFVIWTRLAPSPLDDDGLGGMPSRRYEVAWQVATDERFDDVVRAGSSTRRTGDRARRPRRGRGSAAAGRVLLPLQGRSVGLVHGPCADDPAPGTLAPSLAMAFASCANYPAGYFTAYRHLAEERPDLILHLGDYQYESAAAANALGRPHVGPETRTLANYRQRQALYKTDPDLQLAHAAAPWLVVWDDHEVENNYADEIPENRRRRRFPQRRAAAYRAYYENMPLRRTSLPAGPDMQLFRRVSWGSWRRSTCSTPVSTAPTRPAGTATGTARTPRTRRARSPGRPRRSGCSTASAARWRAGTCWGSRCSSVAVTGTPTPPPPCRWMPGTATRPRGTGSLRGWVEAGVRNPLVLTGDVHAHWASDVLADFADPASEVVGSELVTSSVTSGGDGYDSASGQHPWAAWNPNLRFWTNLRGYVSTTITPEAVTADLRCVRAVSTPDSEVFTRATFVVEDGVRGLQQVADSPLPARSAARRALPDAAQIIADTIREETGS